MSQYNTGTVSLFSGEQCVSGEGTSWLTYVSVGDLFKKRGENAFYFVGAVTSDTTMDLTANYVGSSCSGELYTICRDFTDNYDVPEIWPGDKDWALHITYGLRIFDAKIKEIEDSGVESSLTVTDHGTSTTVTLTTDDLNQIHLHWNTATCTVNLPSVDSGYIGDWVRIAKRGSGELDIVAADSDTIIDTGTTVSNAYGDDTSAFIMLVLESSTHWGCYGMEGRWETS